MQADKLILEDFYDSDDLKMLSLCKLCPRMCEADRLGKVRGYCHSGAGTNIASICIHRGEEPPISGPDGICNIFFSGCNMRCSYCQNYEISRTGYDLGPSGMSFGQAIGFIVQILNKGIKAVGFVSPSHVVPQVKAIIKALNYCGYHPITVYNTSGYDQKETIRKLEDIIDVYMPDFKYLDSQTASEFSDAPDYPEIAIKALKQMYYQKGSVLVKDEQGRAERGILIRHLVLPGHAEESKGILREIAQELSPGLNISLMSQYNPTESVKQHPLLRRRLYAEEYSDVVREMEYLGFRNSWIQEMDSFENYLPDFNKEHPFE
jgi:putative pyruvate formate lyase activating enzyme